MQKTKSSVYNAVATILSTAISSILGLISTNIILKNYGSDFNGVVATVTQLLNVLLLVEGGFTLAINVALFKYFVKDDKDKIKGILSAANKIFIKIGMFFIIVGLIATVIYPIYIKSTLDYTTIFLIFFMIIFSTFFNLIFTTKYRIMFQTAQKEYKISFAGMIVNTICSIITILIVYYKLNMLIARLSIMLFSILNGIIIYLMYKKEFRQYTFKNNEPLFEEIKGTKDVMAQKITGALYTSAPIFFISTFISTVSSSIYAVYTSIYNIAKMILSSIISSPINGFGQLIVEKDKEYVYKKFDIYQYIIILLSILLVVPIVIVINPFISVYTEGVKDINYVSYTLSYLIAGIMFLELIHIPSGNIINVSGNFKKAKQIQYITVIVLIITTLAGIILTKNSNQLYGIMIATLITNILLACLEITYTNVKYFGKSLYKVGQYIVFNIIIAVLLIFLFRKIDLCIINYISFFIKGSIVFCVTSIIIIALNYILFKNNIIEILNIVRNIRGGKINGRTKKKSRSL